MGCLTIRDKIKVLIEKSIKQAQKDKLLPDFDIGEILVERPEEKSHGDYSTNVAMQVCGGGLTRMTTRIDAEKLRPVKIAEIIKDNLRTIDKEKLFEKIEVAGLGFINFFLSEEYLRNKIREIIKEDEKFGRLDFGKKKKIQIEFISANPTGPLTLGNARGAFFGDALARVLEKTGFYVEREYLINDSKDSKQIRELGKTFLGKGESYLTSHLKNLIKILSRDSKIQVVNDEREMGFLLAKKIQEENRKFIEEKLKIPFDFWFSEQKMIEEKKVAAVLDLLENKGVTYEKEGAIWLKTSDFGDNEDRVLVRSDGETTYFLSDIAYHKDKFERGYDKVIDIWGADHHGHQKRMRAALKILGIDDAKLDIIITQLVRLVEKGEEAKISKRTGKFVTLEWLIGEVGQDATRFFFLARSAGSHMDFDIALAKEKSKNNPVYYVQYAHARIASILRRHNANPQMNANAANKKDVILSDSEGSHLFLQTRDSPALPQDDIGGYEKLLNHPSELDLIRELIKFPEIVEDAARDYQIQRLPNYAISLADKFHKFYEDCRVISDDKKMTKARLALTLATKIVIKNILDLMGMSAPEKM